MASAGLQIAGVVMVVIGWFTGIITCVLPMWRVSVDKTAVTIQTVWEGLWMKCEQQSTGVTVCKRYDSLLTMSTEIQAARALTVISIFLTFLGIIICLFGLKCTNCYKNMAIKAYIVIVSGIIFIISGIMVMITVSWTINDIVQEFHDSKLSQTPKMELGASLYTGLISAICLICGGASLCCTCPQRDSRNVQTFNMSETAVSNENYQKEYV